VIAQAAVRKGSAESSLERSREKKREKKKKINSQRGRKSGIKESDLKEKAALRYMRIKKEPF